MRNPHALQVKLSKSNKFGQDKGEELRQGSSTFKSIVMQVPFPIRDHVMIQARSPPHTMMYITVVVFDETASLCCL